MRRLILIALLGFMSLGLMGNGDCDNDKGQSVADRIVDIERDSGPAAPVPEPTSALLFGTGLIILHRATRGARN